MRRVPLPERLGAAAEAGFAGVGLSYSDYVGARVAGLTDSSIVGLLAGYGLQVLEVEFLTGWTRPCEFEADTHRQFLQLLELAATVGAGRINVGGDAPGRDGELASRFGDLCDAAAPFGVTVALEPMPYTNIPDPKSAAEIVVKAARPNGGVLLDTWHVHRAGGLATVADVRPNLVAGIHLADARPVPERDLQLEGEHRRLLPGAGAADLVGFLRRLWWFGVSPCLAVEVISDELQQMPPVRAARLAAEATHALLATARVDVEQMSRPVEATHATQSR